MAQMILFPPAFREPARPARHEGEVLDDVLAEGRAILERKREKRLRRVMALEDAGITRYDFGPDGLAEIEYGGERETPDSFDP